MKTFLYWGRKKSIENDKQIHHLEDFLNVSHNQHVCINHRSRDMLKTQIKEMCEIWQQMNRKWHLKD
jgi:hypothetical protein